MFSTKAEYGVRVMVELARRSRRGTRSRSPRSPSTTACRSPTSSTSWRACARPAWSTRRRGSRGGYLLARPPREITMAEVVEALEGSIAPIECISRGAPTARSSARARPTPTTSARPSCCGRACASRSCSTLQETTLADLLVGPALATGHAAGAACTIAPPDDRSLSRQNMADLEIRDLHVRTEEREILARRRPRHQRAARSTR